MDDIDQRLKDTTGECIKCYEAWQKDKKNEEAREALAEAIHELRKVASRLEIDMAVNEREQMASRPISIPPHRSSRKSQGGDDSGFGDDDIGNNMDDDAGNNGNHGNGNSGGGRRPQNQQRRNNNMNRGRRPGPGGPRNQGGNE